MNEKLMHNLFEEMEKAILKKDLAVKEKDYESAIIYRDREHEYRMQIMRKFFTPDQIKLLIK